MSLCQPPLIVLERVVSSNSVKKDISYQFFFLFGINHRDEGSKKPHFIAVSHQLGGDSEATNIQMHRVGLVR